MFDIRNYSAEACAAVVCAVAFVLDFAVFFGADLHRVFARKWGAPADNPIDVIMSFIWRLGLFILAYPVAFVVAFFVVVFAGLFIHYGFYE